MADTKKYLHNLNVANNKVMNLLLNPLTTVQRTAIGGTLGLSDQSYVCYDTTLNQQYFWDGTQWITVGGGSIGPGTTNYLSKWDALGTDLIDSQVYDDGTYVRIGIGGGAMSFPYEKLILEAPQDMKFGAYTSVNSFAAGGASYVLGYTNITTALGYYPGFEFQMSGASIDADNFIRYNFLQRNTAGIVIASNPNIFNIYADNRVSFKKLIGTGTEMVVADASGFISRQAIPTGGVTSVTATSPLSSSGGATPDISITQASASTNGYLSSTDWTTFNNKVGGSGTATRVAFWDTTFSISSDSALYWDNTNKRFGIGTASPTYKLDVNGEINTNVGIRLGTNGAQTGIYGGANIFDFWAGNNKIATWGLASLNGTYYDYFASPVYNTGDSGIITSFKIRSSVTSIGANTAGATQLDISPIYTQSTFGTGTLRGVYYHPQINSLNSSTHIAWENTTGDIIHGNLATGGADEMVTVDTSGKLKKQTIPSGSTSPLTTKGDLYTYDTANARLGVGTVGDILTPDTAEATGLKWVKGKTSQLTNDGDNGYTHFISVEDLPSNLVLYATNVASGISTYTKAVSTLTDPDYNTTAVDIPIGPLTSTTIPTFCGGIISSANIIIGNPGIFTMSTLGSIRRTSGSADGIFFYEVYKRDAGGTETLIVTSDSTVPVSATVYTEFNASALFNNGVFTATDRVVIKFYGLKASSGSNPSFNFQFGGTAPVRTTLPIPLTVTPLPREILSVSTNTAALFVYGIDYIYFVSGTTTITLPTAVGNVSKYTIKRVGTGVVSIATTSSQTIDGSSSPININVQYVSIDLMSNGANWFII